MQKNKEKTGKKKQKLSSWYEESDGGSKRGHSPSEGREMGKGLQVWAWGGTID